MNWKKIRLWSAMTVGLVMAIGWIVLVTVKSFDPAVQERMMRWQQEHPFSPFDFWVGFVTAAFLFFGLFFWEEFRFDRDMRRGGDDGGPGTMRLPFSNKVIPIDEVRRIWHEKYGHSEDEDISELVR